MVFSGGIWECRTLNKVRIINFTQMDFWSKYDILYTTVLIQEMIPEEFTFPSDTKYVMFTQQPWG